MNNINLTILGSTPFSNILNELEFNNILNQNNISNHSDKKIKFKCALGKAGIVKKKTRRR